MPSCGLARFASALTIDRSRRSLHRPVSVRGYSRLRSAALRRAGEERPFSLADFTAELLGLADGGNDTEEEPHIPLEPDDERNVRRRRRR